MAARRENEKGPLHPETYPRASKKKTRAASTIAPAMADTIALRFSAASNVLCRSMHRSQNWILLARRPPILLSTLIKPPQS
jgi:hypothetical protein